MKQRRLGPLRRKAGGGSPILPPSAIVPMQQRRFDDCAITAAAMVANGQYEAIARLVHPKKSIYGAPDKSLYATTDQLAKALRALGYRTRFTGDFIKRRRPAIILFGWGRCGPYHCVVWDPNLKRFHDPANHVPYDNEFYIMKWKQFDRETLVIEGKYG